jgi:hypothetical protein
MQTRNLQSIVQSLRTDGGFRNVEARVFNGRSHDRFIINDHACWQMGTSFNSIGKVVSTIVRLPVHSAVSELFENFWCEAQGLNDE